MQIKYTLLLLLLPAMAMAQHFKPVQINPFGMLQNEDLSLTGFTLADINNDSLADLLFTDDASFETYLAINQGNANEPDFSQATVVTFTIETDNYGYGSLILPNSRLVDFDNDNDADHLYAFSSDDPDMPADYVVEYNTPEIATTENYLYLFLQSESLTEYGVPYLPFFTYTYFDYHSLTNNNSLPDIFELRYDENTEEVNFAFYERLTQDQFVEPLINPFGLQPGGSELFGMPCLIDPDNDGDQDILVLSGFTGNWFYYRNVGTGEAPEFAEPEVNPMGLTPLSDFGLSAIVVDFNNDGKDDIVAASLTDFYYFEFDTEVSTHNTGEHNASIQVFPTLVHTDCTVTTTDNTLKMNRMCVTDGNGQVRSTKNDLASYSETIDLSAFAPGAYFISLWLENGDTVTKKVIKL